MTAEVNQLITESRDERKKEQRVSQSEPLEPWLKSEHLHPPLGTWATPDLHWRATTAYPCTYLIQYIYPPPHTHTRHAFVPPISTGTVKALTGDSLIAPAGLSLTAVSSSLVSHRSTAEDPCQKQLNSIHCLCVFVHAPRSFSYIGFQPLF